MLADEHNPVSKRKALMRPLLDRRFERSVREDDRARSCDRPPDVVCVPFPQLNAIAHIGDVVEVGICELPQQLVHAEIELRGAAPKLACLGTQMLQEAERMELAALVVGGLDS
jgi:hypothetical protein